MANAQGPDPKGAIAAMLAIDPKYSNGILKVSGSKGSPQPGRWEILAKGDDQFGELHQITVADGQVISDHSSMNAAEAERGAGFISPPTVQFDSGDVFQTAFQYAAANQQVLGWVNYSLAQGGDSAAPVWTLACFNMNGLPIGKLTVLATTGSVLSHPGFRNQPAAQQ